MMTENKHMEKMLMNNKAYGYKIENFNVIISDGESFEDLETRGFITKDGSLTSFEDAYNIASYERKKLIRDILLKK